MTEIKELKDGDFIKIENTVYQIVNLSTRPFMEERGNRVIFLTLKEIMFSKSD